MLKPNGKSLFEASLNEKLFCMGHCILLLSTNYIDMSQHTSTSAAPEGLLTSGFSAGIHSRVACSQAITCTAIKQCSPNRSTSGVVGLYPHKTRILESESILMKAFVVNEFGQPEDMRIQEIEMVAPREGEVQIKVMACGINFADVLMVQGLYQVKPPFPFSPGLEVSGVVEAVGAGVDHLAVGDSVLAIVNWGGLAEYVNAPAPMTIKLPPTMSHQEAAAFPIAYGTSHVALDHRARLLAGETVLISGAAGGAGLTAVELSKLMGATVIACVSTQAKAEIAKQYGADEVILYTEQPVRETVKQLVGGVDVVYDVVGGDFFNDAIRVMNWEGRYLVVGFASGTIPELPINRVLIKNTSLVGVFWGAYALNKPMVMFQSLQTLLNWHHEGRLHPHISQVFPFEQTADALLALRNRESTGKVVVSIADNA